MRQSFLSQNINLCENMKTYHLYVQCSKLHQAFQRMRKSYPVWFYDLLRSISVFWIRSYNTIKFIGNRYKKCENQQNSNMPKSFNLFRMPMKSMKTLKWILMRWIIYRLQTTIRIEEHSMTPLCASVCTLFIWRIGKLNELDLKPENWIYVDV